MTWSYSLKCFNFNGYSNIKQITEKKAKNKLFKINKTAFTMGWLTPEQFIYLFFSHKQLSGLSREKQFVWLVKLSHLRPSKLQGNGCSIRSVQLHILEIQHVSTVSRFSYGRYFFSCQHFVQFLVLWCFLSFFISFYAVLSHFIFYWSQSVLVWCIPFSVLETLIF